MAEETEVKVPQFIRSEDFASVYSNFTKFEPTLWDLKLLFGEIVEQNAEGGVIENHTAVSMAWSSAKLMALYLALNIAVYERDNGPISIPDTVLQTDIRHLATTPTRLTEMIEKASKIRASPLPKTPLPQKKR